MGKWLAAGSLGVLALLALLGLDLRAPSANVLAAAAPAHPAAEGWGDLSAANCSYEYFPNDGKANQNPQRVLTRCPIHGNIGLFDGSVQMSVMKNHPEWVVRGSDGQLYFHVPAQPEQGNPRPNDSSNP